MTRYSRDVSEFDRALAFIDATFAVALTLLITGLEIDDTASSFTSVSKLADAVGPGSLPSRWLLASERADLPVVDLVDQRAVRECKPPRPTGRVRCRRRAMSSP